MAPFPRRTAIALDRLGVVVRRTDAIIDRPGVVLARTGATLIRASAALRRTGAVFDRPSVARARTGADPGRPDARAGFQTAAFEQVGSVVEQVGAVVDRSKPAFEHLRSPRDALRAGAVHRRRRPSPTDLAPAPRRPLYEGFMNHFRVIAAAALLSACSQREELRPPEPRPEAAAATSIQRGTSAMTFHSFSAAPLGLTEPVSLSKYKGEVLLVANTAAHCGYTPQYKPLGEVDRKYRARGFRVLGFVSDDFGHQAGTVEEVKACSLENRAQFDQFSEVHVKKGPDQHPLFAWLTSQPGLDGDVRWNFAKWLIGRNGEVIARWGSDAEPDGPEITQAIEAALAK
jgi:glutathione peroxidase